MYRCTNTLQQNAITTHVSPCVYVESYCMTDRMIADFILAESCEESGQVADILVVHAMEVSCWKSICKWDIHSEEDIQK